MIVALPSAVLIGQPVPDDAAQGQVTTAVRLVALGWAAALTSSRPSGQAGWLGAIRDPCRHESAAGVSDDQYCGFDAGANMSRDRHAFAKGHSSWPLPRL